MIIKNTVVAVAISGVLVLIGGASQSVMAQAVSSTPTVEELQKQIQTLLNQMASLQKEIASLKSGVSVPAVPTATAPLFEATVDESEMTVETETELILPPLLNRSLSRGARGDDVRQLQEFLTQDPTIYPEGIASGYYGISTEAAVRKWQAKNGLPAVGVVGRQTISKFKEMNSRGSVGTELVTPTTVTPPTTETVKREVRKEEVCPTTPSVVSCPAGEERVVTYKSEQCGVYYACKPKPRETTLASNTVATLKKTSSIQTDNRYTLILNDPEGIQRFTVINTKGAEVQSGYPACRKDWTTPTFTIDSAAFPPKLTLYDCGSPSSQYTTILNTPVLVQQVEGTAFPYTFTNGKIVNSYSEANAYCYANGPGGGQGVVAECETKFGIVYQQVTSVSSGGSSGRAIYSSASFESCMTRYGFKAEAGQIKGWAQSPDPMPWSVLSSGAQNSVTVCEKEYYGQQTTESGAVMCSDGRDNDGDGFIDAADSSCYGSITPTPVVPTTPTTATTQTTQTVTGSASSNWVRHVWNFRDGLTESSYILNRADQEYSDFIARIHAQCLTINRGQFAWLPNAGNDAASNWQNFGIPNCTGTASTYSGYSGGTVSGSCSALSSQWPVQYGNYCLNSSRTQYVSLASLISSPTSALGQACTGNNSPMDGCTTPGASAGSSCGYGYYWSGTSCVSSSTATSSSCPSGQYWYMPPSGGAGYCQSSTSAGSSCPSGNYWNGSACVPSTAPTCPSGNYWNGNACVSSAVSSGCSAPGNCFDSSVCTSSGWYWYNGVCSSSPQPSPSTSCSSGQYWNGSSCVASTPSPSASCSSDQYWNGSSCVSSSSAGGSSCSSGQYWNGSSCVASTPSGSTTTTCPSGNYWNGTACVPSTAPTCPSGNYWNGSACVPTTTPPSASVYDQMKNQLKSMEIILRGLMGR